MASNQGQGQGNRRPGQAGQGQGQAGFGSGQGQGQAGFGSGQGQGQAGFGPGLGQTGFAAGFPDQGQNRGGGQGQQVRGSEDEFQQRIKDQVGLGEDMIAGWGPAGGEMGPEDDIMGGDTGRTGRGNTGRPGAAATRRGNFIP